MALKRSIDTPTNTFATLNPLFRDGTHNISHNGNLTYTSIGSTDEASGDNIIGTTQNIPTFGKWYFEVYCASLCSGEGKFGSFGLADIERNNFLVKGYTNSWLGHVDTNPSDSENLYLMPYYGGGASNQNGHIRRGSWNGGTSLINNIGWVDGATAGLFLDCDNDEVAWFINGSIVIDKISKPNLSNGSHAFLLCYWNSSGSTTYHLNFGQNPTFCDSHTPSRIYTDASGYGEFAYEPPAGAMALCTANITPANLTSAPYVVDETGNHSISVAGTKNVEISSKSPYLADFSGSVYIDGSNGSAVQGSGDFSPTNNDYSIECNVKFNENGWAKQPSFFQAVRMDNGNKTSHFWFGYMNDALVVSKHGDGNLLVECPWTPEANRWYHIKAERKFEESLNLYIDGVQLDNFRDGAKRNAHKKHSFASNSDGMAIGARGSNDVINGYIHGVKWKIGNEIRYSQERDGLPGFSGSARISSENPDFSGSPNVRHTEMKSRASQNFKGGSYVIDTILDLSKGSAIRIPETGSNFTFGTDPYTLEMWMYSNSGIASGRRPLLSHRFSGAGVNKNEWAWFVNGNSLEIHHPGAVVVSGDPCFGGDSTGQWFHIVWCREGTGTNQSSFYVNGVRVINHTLDASYNWSSDSDLFIGWDFETSNAFSGKLADIRITKGEALYTGETFDVPTEPLTATDNTVLLVQPWKQAINLGGYKQIDHSQESPKDHFKAVTWSGNTSENDIAVGFEPGLFWGKQTNGSGLHDLRDIVRGNSRRLTPSADGQQLGNDNGNGYNGFKEFTSTGVKLDDDGGGGDVNTDGRNYVGWFWKAGGVPSGATSATGSAKRINSSGTQDDTSCSELATAATDAGASNVITPTLMSINQKAGFSIVKYTASSEIATTPHGLSKKPELMIFKNLDTTSNWDVITDILDGSLQYLWLNTTNAVNQTGWGSSPTDHVMSVYSYNSAMIAYCWHSVPGYSSFGSYIGNDSTDGPFVNCGFRPAFIIIKQAHLNGQTGGNSWWMTDSARENSPNALRVNTDASENTGNSAIMPQYLSNGFKIKGRDSAVNADGSEYIYMAFADSSTFGELGTKSKKNPMIVNPKQGFKAVTWVGQSQSDWDGTIGTVECGFKPDLVWWKNRDFGHDHGISDSVRGPNFRLYPTYPNSDVSSPDTIQSFEPNGFKIGSENGINNPAYNYIGWAWKAGGSGADFMKDGEEDTSIATGGSITPDKMSVGTETGFSIIKYTGKNGAATIPHGLSQEPEMVIFKKTTASSNWIVHRNGYAARKFLYLNNSNKLSDAGADMVTDYSNSLLSLGTDGDVNPSDGAGMIMYCWHSVPGYSAFGSYTGNGSPDGPFIYTGFKPAFFMSKRTDISGYPWMMFDNSRSEYNPVNEYLFADDNSVFDDGNYQDGQNDMQFLSNGIKLGIGGGINNDTTSEYIYMAFAEQPYEFATSR